MDLKKILIALIIVYSVSNASAIMGEYSYPFLLDRPWDHSPITVYIDDVNVPPHYSPGYRDQVILAMEYWEEGGNGKLNYIPEFTLTENQDADIAIRWVENMEKVTGAPEGVAGHCISYEDRGKYVRSEIVLEVGNYEGFAWRQYGNSNMRTVAKHELGHALGLDHSTDKKDIMYPTYDRREDVNPLLLEATYPFLIATILIITAAIGYQGIRWRHYHKLREKLEEDAFDKNELHDH